MQEVITDQVLEFRRQISDLLWERLMEAVGVVLVEELQTPAAS